MQRTIRTLLLGVMILLLSGCSIKFAYNNLDRFVRWQVDDYLDLDRAQKTLLQEQLTELLYWHRKNHLPLYADYLQMLSLRVGDGVDIVLIDAMFEQLTLWGEEVQARALPGAIELLAGLSDEQVAGLPERMEESNEELAEPELDVELQDAQQLWAEDFEDAVERFTGRLDRAQKDYILRRADAYQPERVKWAEYRRRWQSEFMDLLAKRDQRELFAAGIEDLITDPEQFQDDELLKISAHNRQLTKEVASHILSNLSDKQADRFSDNLLKLSEDLRELSEAAG